MYSIARCVGGDTVRAVTTDGGNVDHALAEFNKGTTIETNRLVKRLKHRNWIAPCTAKHLPLLGQVHISDISKNEVDKLVILLVTDPLNEALDHNQGLANFSHDISTSLNTIIRTCAGSFCPRQKAVKPFSEKQ